MAMLEGYFSHRKKTFCSEGSCSSALRFAWEPFERGWKARIASWCAADGVDATRG
eukprot:jgi/Pico_ML_1/52552/g3241.t1